MDLQFALTGGLGNQIFQYLASQYILKTFSNIKISYSFNSNDRNFDLNSLLVNKIDLQSEIKHSFIKRFNYKLTKNFINKKDSDIIIKHRLSTLNEFRETDFNFEQNIINRLELLKVKLGYLKNNPKRFLKIIGFWENPSSYINLIDQFNYFFINTHKFLPAYIKSNNYICMHIRRGDYVDSKEQIQSLLSRYSSIQHLINSLIILPDKYEKLPLYIVTDDKLWTNSWAYLFAEKFKKEIKVLSNESIIDWSIMRHASINISANSTFSYTAALLNSTNKRNKLRCIIPQWHRSKESTYEKGWNTPNGFIEI